ncbi:hypothetical protein DPEC_G00171170 [Dallia pectoralis]|uniref:Uncharacterized protein n=1 Tax=Dallia pectoralis TaxID=75939 RepID=A0ACC2GDS5_DALPE|nr:hypothetical protein DPEC_G00171170 [Dallia pectoralis]
MHIYVSNFLVHMGKKSPNQTTFPRVHQWRSSLSGVVPCPLGTACLNKRPRVNRGSPVQNPPTDRPNRGRESATGKRSGETDCSHRRHVPVCLELSGKKGPAPV